MTRQFSKDPNEVLDYPWPVPLDSGDTIAAFVAVLVSGDVVIDSYSHDNSIGTIWLSGGTNDTVSVITLTATTTGGRTFETTAVVSVVDSSNILVSALRARFPAFASVPDATIAYWLKDAGLIVTDAWDAGDFEPALLTLAAHNMALLGLDKASGAVGSLAAMGVTSFKSASMSVNFDADTIKATNSGSYSSTKYGQLFLPYLRRNVGGPRLVGCA